MKPLLRTFLAINAVFVALLGLFFLMTPWLTVSAPLAPLASAPALIGQLLGVFLLGFAWMLLAGMVRGPASATIAWVAGHVQWLAGAVVLVWQVRYHQPAMQDDLTFIVPIVAIAIVVLGLVQGRLASMVGRRERLERRRFAEGQAAARGTQRRERTAVAPPLQRDPYIGSPVAGVPDAESEPRRVPPAF